MRLPKIIICLIPLFFILSNSFARTGEPGLKAGTVVAEKSEPPAFPYVAEITGMDVYVRSGPGSNYYRCGKVSKPDRVTVTGHEHSWSKILPLPGSFSWISTRYVKFDANEPDVGIITGNTVRIWAGSPYQEPIHSTSLQTKLNKGDTVKLLGEEKSDYYKIVPPDGAYFYVSTEYTKYLGGIEEVEPISTDTGEAGKPAVVPTTLSIESIKLKEYYELAEKVELERKKSVAEQNYVEIKQALEAIAGDPDSGKAGRYAGFELELIKRFKLAREADREIRALDAELARVREDIKARKKVRLEEIPDLGRFAVTGYLRQSQVYMAKATKLRLIVVGDNGKIICYAQTAPGIDEMDLTKVLDKKVGLVGTIHPDPATGGCLVQFVDVDRIE